MAAWRAAGHDWTLSVNVSSHHFTIGDVVAATEAALGESGLEPSHALRLEITESVLMAHPERAIRGPERLRARGTLVQVDDFGTGYSSLAYLQRLPIDALKLDRSFVAGLDDGTRAIVAAVGQMAHHLGIDVIAEGIESQEQADWLAGLGCRFGQGYLYTAARRGRGARLGRARRNRPPRGRPSDAGAGAARGGSPSGRQSGRVAAATVAATRASVELITGTAPPSATTSPSASSSGTSVQPATIASAPAAASRSATSRSRARTTSSTAPRLTA
jgi:EAL domain-containing protein (putative c-di-GMP-specific phosphodiesterase class I)